MSKIAINNEIVLMRQAVRQSKVAVVRKLIKEAKLLNARKHGDEKILEKCKRKADRLLKEIAAMKKLKDDDITKFAIGEKRKLQDILNDTQMEANVRVMARLTYHKVLNERVAKFREKFPNHEKYLGPGRKKLAKLERKLKRDDRNAIKNKENSSEENGQVIATKEIDETSADGPAISERLIEDGEFSENMTSDAEPIDDSRTSSCDEENNDSVKNLGKKDRAKQSKENKKESQKVSKIKAVKSDKIVPIKVISDEASVKRLGDLADETQPEIIRDTTKDCKKSEMIIEKQVDSFFFTGDGGNEYMSVVVPKNTNSEDHEPRINEYSARLQGHERNNRFFSKIDSRNDRDDKFRGRPEKRKFDNYPRENSGDNFPGKYPRKNARTNDKPKYEEKSSAKEEEVHPSWAAKKKQQEILKQGFQGKKIVFDD